jgi:hypothetical protein
MEQQHQQDEAVETPVKKAFVEPKISSPIDVLEATTYFQVVDSGGTGLLPGLDQRQNPNW